MASKYFATLISHDGLMLVELNKYRENIIELMEDIHPHYSIGGILKGEFIGNFDLGTHLISFDQFILGVLEEAKYSAHKTEIEDKVKQLADLQKL